MTLTSVFFGLCFPCSDLVGLLSGSVVPRRLGIASAGAGVFDVLTFQLEAM